MENTTQQQTTTDSQSEQISLTDEQKFTPKSLPTAYVLWLTIRSQFLDTLCATTPELLDEWKEFETMRIKEIQEEQITIEP